MGMLVVSALRAVLLEGGPRRTPCSVAPMALYGSQSMTGRLERVLVRPPLPEDGARWREYGWRAAPDLAAAAAEHESFARDPRGCRRRGRRLPATIPATPTRSTSTTRCSSARTAPCSYGPGKEGRRGEPDAIAAALAAAGVPIAAELAAPGDRRGRRHGLARRRDAARRHRLPDEPCRPSARSADAFPGVEVIAFDLPHWNGRGEVMHLMSFISPLDRDLALVYPRIAPVRLLELLAERGIEVVEVPDEEFETQGPNVLALGPRHALALDGNPETRRRMERPGVDVVVYRGEEISRKGDGGPTCLTRPLLRT